MSVKQSPSVQTHQFKQISSSLVTPITIANRDLILKPSSATHQHVAGSREQQHEGADFLGLSSQHSSPKILWFSLLLHCLEDVDIEWILNLAIPICVTCLASVKPLALFGGGRGGTSRVLSHSVNYISTGAPP